MTKISRALIGALLLAITGCSDDTPAGTNADLRAELSKLREQIAEAKETAQRYEGGQIGEVAAMRREVLLLSAAMLENRLIADEGGVPAKVVAPTLTSNPARAKQLLRHISATEEAIEQAKEEAAGSEGVAASLAQTKVVTQELTLAQLQLAFYQSAFGLAFSGEPESAAVAAGGTMAQTPDGDMPEPAGQPAKEVPAKEAPTREAPTREAPTREAGATQGDVTSEPLPTPGENAKNSGREPAPAPADPKEAEKDVSTTSDGTKTVTAAPPEPISQPPARHYSREDYVRIQLLLQEAGFNPGTIDGRWGPQTQGAMADFQRASGLSPSGRPDPTTLDALGFN